MKHLISFFTLAAMIFSLSAHAEEKSAEDRSEQFFQRKTEIMQRRLGLSDEQMEKFVPLYREYNEAMREAMGERTEYTKTDDAKEEAARIKRRLGKQKDALDVQISYIDKFADILTAEQLHKFLRVEQNIHHKVRDSRLQRERKGYREKKGRRGRPMGKRGARSRNVR